MARIVVAGLVNVETTVLIGGFPVAYEPVLYPFDGVRATVSGVGLNVAKALRTLGDDVRFLTIVGPDEAGRVRAACAAAGLDPAGVLDLLPETPRSVILCAPDGRRQIHVDLKRVQETPLPADRFDEAADGCDAAVLCNVNFARPLLERARARGLPVATDVHALAGLDGEYDRDYVAAADVLFMSHERLPAPPEAVAAEVLRRHRAGVVVVGLGPDGALLAPRGAPAEHLPAVRTRPIASTIGAGDALFSAFVHFLMKGLAPRPALERALVFASWKIGETGAAEGFATEEEVESLLPKSGGSS